MDDPRPEKVAVVDEVKSKLEASNGVILTEYRGLDVSAMAELRKSVRDAGAEYKVYKNTLVRFAARDLDLDLDELLTGPTAVAFATPTVDGKPGDTVALAKALVDFAKANDKLIVKGGLLGDVAIDADGVTALAKTPPRVELYAEFLGAGLSFYQEFAGLLDSKLREFSYALQELADKGVLAEGDAPKEAADEDSAQPEAPEAGADDTEAADETSEAAAAADDPAADAAGETEIPTETEAVAEVPDESGPASDSTEEE
jgi:large subunit ribosomal protein L10